MDGFETYQVTCDLQAKRVTETTEVENSLEDYPLEQGWRNHKAVAQPGKWIVITTRGFKAVIGDEEFHKTYTKKAEFRNKVLAVSHDFVLDQIDIRRMLEELVYTWTRYGRHVKDPTLPNYLLWELRSTLEFKDGNIKHTDAAASAPGIAIARWEFAQDIVRRFLSGEKPPQETGKMEVPGCPEQQVVIHRSAKE